MNIQGYVNFSGIFHGTRKKIGKKEKKNMSRLKI